MKLEWIGEQLFVGPHCLGRVEWHDGKYGFLSSLCPIDPRRYEHDTQKAAKAAAEKAVKDWFRECLGEPVAYFSDHGGDIDIGVFSLTREEAEVDCTEDDRVVPLYALEADE